MFIKRPSIVIVKGQGSVNATVTGILIEGGFNKGHFSTFLIHNPILQSIEGPVTTVAPRCLLGLTFTDFDSALKRNELFGYCGLDFV